MIIEKNKLKNKFDQERLDFLELKEINEKLKKQASSDKQEKKRLKLNLDKVVTENFYLKSILKKEKEEKLKFLRNCIDIENENKTLQKKINNLQVNIEKMKQREMIKEEEYKEKLLITLEPFFKHRESIKQDKANQEMIKIENMRQVFYQSISMNQNPISNDNIQKKRNKFSNLQDSDSDLIYNNSPCISDTTGSLTRNRGNKEYKKIIIEDPIVHEFRGNQESILI